jgi:hypothetical protein
LNTNTNDQLDQIPLKRILVAIVTAFVLAIVHQYLFFGNVPGVSFLIFVILFYLYMFLDSKATIRNTSLFGWFLFAIIILLSMTYLLLNNPIFYALNFVVVPPLIFLHITYLRSFRKLDWWDIRLLIDALDHLVHQSLRHLPTGFRIVRTSTVTKLGDRQKSIMGKVLIGLAIALPLVLIVMNLLASADGVFNRFLSVLPSWWSNLSLDDSIGRLVWIVIFGLLFFGYLWGFVDPKKAAKAHVELEAEERKEEKKSSKIDPIILVTLLVSVNAVYVLFVLVQFSYLFGAWEGVLPDGKSYAEYARSGFVELITVSMINFAILMVTLVYGGQGNSVLKKMTSILLYILVGCSSVMLYSAYMRLVLYEEAFGYTYIRFLVHAFMIYLGVLLLIAALRIRSQRIPLAKVYIVVSLSAYVLINYIGMDTLIAEKNIERFRENGRIDAPYLNSLSTDAIPLLIKFSKQEYPAMKPLLEGRWTTLMQENRHWQTFNASHYRAEKALEHYLWD